MTDTLLNPKPEEKAEPKLEVAFVVMLPLDGSSVIIETEFKSQGMECRRKITWDDIYRMVCDAKSQCEAMRASATHMSAMRQLSADVLKDRTKNMILRGGKA